MTEEDKKATEQAAADNERAQAKQPGHMALLGVVAAAALVAACAIGAAIGQGAGQQASSTASQPTQQASASASSPASGEAEAQPAEHVWQPVYGVVHVDKQTHIERRDATYRQETVNETVCNDCKAVITGKAQEHIEKTGHSGFTRGVPVVEDVLDAPAQDVEVTDWEAHDEYRLTGYSCECGKKLTLDEAKETGVYSEADEYQGDDASGAEN